GGLGGAGGRNVAGGVVGASVNETHHREDEGKQVDVHGPPASSRHRVLACFECGAVVAALAEHEPENVLGADPRRRGATAFAADVEGPAAPTLSRWELAPH